MFLLHCHQEAALLPTHYTTNTRDAGHSWPSRQCNRHTTPRHGIIHAHYSIRLALIVNCVVKSTYSCSLQLLGVLEELRGSREGESWREEGRVEKGKNGEREEEREGK